MRGKSWEHIINKKYGLLTVISLKKASGSEKTIAVCKCSCGNMKTVRILELEKGHYKTCGECHNGVSYESFVGKKYGNLTVVDMEKNFAVCKCTCGNIKTIQISQLKTMHHKTCGECYNGISYESFIGKKYGSLTVVNVKKGVAVCKCTCGNIKEFPTRKIVRNVYATCRECYNGVSFKSFIGKKYGSLTVVDVEKNFAVCECTCGNMKTIQISQLKFSGYKTCGGCYKGISYKNYIGKIFGYLTITNIQHEKNNYTAFCVCKCGKEKKIKFQRLLQETNTSLSCGCLQKTIKALKKITFGSLNIVKTSNHNLGGLRYVCKCSCGNEVEVLESDLFTGKVTCCEECSKL